jgi:polyhydroxyalkanoate synthesis regulator protein
MKDDRIIVKKYPSRTIFKSSTSMLKITKEKEMLLKAIIKEIDRLNQEMEKILR